MLSRGHFGRLRALGFWREFLPIAQNCRSASSFACHEFDGMVMD